MATRMIHSSLCCTVFTTKDVINKLKVLQKKQYLYVKYLIKDCCSWLNGKRQGFTQLTGLIAKGKVNKVVIEHKDRLTRFQFEIIKNMYAVFGRNIIVLGGEGYVSGADELTRDLLNVI